MRIGLAIPQYGFSLPSGTIGVRDAIAWARHAEELGFDSVWLSDHFFYSFARYGAGDEPIAALEPITTMAAVAAATSRIRLGVLVLCATFRHPALVAKSAATIDRISNGRVEVGLGAGWLSQEFDAFGYRFGEVRERFAALDDALTIVRGLFDGVEPLSHRGTMWSIREGRLRPPPMQAQIPLWAGGKGGRRLLRLAARSATGWNTVWRMSPDAYAEKLREVRAACDAEGRDHGTFHLSLGLYGSIGRTEDDARAAFERARGSFPGDGMRDESWESWRADTLSGSVEQVRERAVVFEALGVHELVVSPWVLPFTVREPEQVDVFAQALLPG
jgi:probable F420-dependent oxidoreductase